jgi:hypothetical protein
MSINNIKIKYEKNALFPFFLDYDFKKMRPRGFTSKIAFFSYGFLCKLVDEIKPYDGLLFIKNKFFVFSEGFFLIDYEDIINNYDVYETKFINMKMNRIYFTKDINEKILKQLVSINSFEIYIAEFE